MIFLASSGDIDLGLELLKLNPSASAPAMQASRASSGRVIPQILIFVMGVKEGSGQAKNKGKQYARKTAVSSSPDLSDSRGQGNAFCRRFCDLT
jgi:hypothetical protein